MSLWGEKNLDSYMAMEEMSRRSDQLIAQFMKRLKSTKSRRLRHPEHHCMFVDLEMILALETTAILDGYTLPAPEEIHPIIERWIRGWNKELKAAYISSEIKVKRRRMVMDNFEKLERMCKKYKRLREAIPDGSESDYQPNT